MKTLLPILRQFYLGRISLNDMATKVNEIGQFHFYKSANGVRTVKVTVDDRLITATI
jgi:hypothetical protein